MTRQVHCRRNFEKPLSACTEGGFCAAGNRAAGGIKAGLCARNSLWYTLNRTDYTKRREIPVEDYRTIRGTAAGEYEEKKSRFIAQLSFADSEEAALAFLEQVRQANRTARHNVYAYRLRADHRERYSDDGEPAKTAGTPALEVLQHSGLTDLIVVITRYFGGVLLGTGGLVRAYTTATSRALANAEVVTVRSVIELCVELDYSLYDRAAVLITASGAKMAEPLFTDRVTLRWQMPEGTQGPLLEQLRELTRGSGQVQVSEPFYAPF